MKKCLLLLFAVCFLIAGCSSNTALPQKRIVPVSESKKYMVGVWLSYSEINAIISDNGLESNLNKVISNLNSISATDIFIHVRAFCDSIYPSKLFPQTEFSNKYNYDIFEYMITKCHENGIRVHAWINPYRVSSATNDINALSDKCLAKSLYNKDVSNIGITENGIYLNPASEQCKKAVVDGIREILDNYAVDGIHFDDYFYPTTAESFDSESYKRYCENTKVPFGLDEYRRANVNSLIAACYTAIKFKDKNITFSISPAADIDKNYSCRYADIKSFCESGCVDLIIPQLYFGFSYPDNNFCFDTLLNRWENELKDTNVKIAVGIASYKVGTNAEPDCEEWHDNTDILSRQCAMCKSDKNICGHIFFSYSSLFSSSAVNIKAREKIK